MGTFMVEANRNPTLFEEFKRQVIEPRRRPLREALERGQAAGQLRGDLDIEVALDLLVSPVLAALVTGGQPDAGAVRARVDAVWPALAAAGSRRASDGGGQRDRDLDLREQLPDRTLCGGRYPYLVSH